MQWRCVKPRRQCRQPRRLLPQHHRASAAMPTASGRICVYVYVRVCASQRDDEERRENARQNRVRPMCRPHHTPLRLLAAAVCACASCSVTASVYVFRRHRYRSRSRCHGHRCACDLPIGRVSMRDGQGYPRVDRGCWVAATTQCSARRVCACVRVCVGAWSPTRTQRAAAAQLSRECQCVCWQQTPKPF